MSSRAHPTRAPRHTRTAVAAVVTTRRRIDPLVAGVIALLGGLVALQLWSVAADYAMRVTSDSPTFITLLSDMARNPLGRQSPFLAHGEVATQHATPYTLLLSQVWRLLGGEAGDPYGAARFLAPVGIAVFGVTLLAVFSYARSLAGNRAAWATIPVLLTLFGPAHVIWASDLTFHGALYAGFYPQNVAIALTLVVLIACERRTPTAVVVAIVATAGTLTVHPFTGVLLCALVTTRALQLAHRGDPHYVVGPIVLAAGYVTGLLWPAYNLNVALAETGVHGAILVSGCVILPIAIYALPSAALMTSVGAMVDASVARATDLRLAVTRIQVAVDGPRAPSFLALVGLGGVILLALWELLLIQQASLVASFTDPIARAWPRLAIYWVDERWRWPLMFLGGTAGLLGLRRLATRGSVVPAVWFTACFSLGVAGAFGAPVPVWYRFLLFCQIPLAIGVAVVFTESSRLTRAAIGGTVAVSLLVKVATLLALTTSFSYFGASLQNAWSLGEHIPPAPGIVATDPQTAYFIPAASGKKVLTVSQGHVGSAYERDLSDRGYRLLREFYAGGPGWWQAGRTMYQQGVRYLVIEKNTTLEPRTLADFTWQNAMLRPGYQRKRIGNYFYEANRVGTLVYDSYDYVVYTLDARKLFGRS